MKLKNCEYCNLLSGDVKNLTCDDLLTIERHNNIYTLEVNGNNEEDRASTEISYCPMCGRKLGG